MQQDHDLTNELTTPNKRIYLPLLLLLPMTWTPVWLLNCACVAVWWVSSGSGIGILMLRASSTYVREWLVWFILLIDRVALFITAKKVSPILNTEGNKRTLNLTSGFSIWLRSFTWISSLSLTGSPWLGQWFLFSCFGASSARLCTRHKGEDRLGSWYFFGVTYWRLAFFCCLACPQCRDLNELRPKHLSGQEQVRVYL